MSATSPDRHLERNTGAIAVNGEMNEHPLAEPNMYESFKEAGKKIARKVTPYVVALASLFNTSFDYARPEQITEDNSRMIVWSECRETQRNYEIDKMMLARQDSLNANARSDYDLRTFDSRINSQMIPVPMFHMFGEKSGSVRDRYTVTPIEFDGMLEHFYVNGYAPVSAEEFTKGDFQRIPGKKPYLITLDDAHPSQFNYVPGYKDSIDSRCAVGIMEKFEKRHPGVDMRAIFFISAGNDQGFYYPFGDEKTLRKKIKFMLDNNYDIGYHTADHIHHKRASIDDIKRQEFYLSSILNAYSDGRINEDTPKHFAYPFGEKPLDYNVLQYINSEFEFTYDAWGGRSHHPMSKAFDSKRIPRIETNTHTFGIISSGMHTDYRVLGKDAELYAERFNEKKLNPSIIASTR